MSITFKNYFNIKYIFKKNHIKIYLLLLKNTLKMKKRI